MPTRPSNISFDLSFKKAKSSEPIDDEAPLRIAILGSFSGRSGRDDSSLRAIRVDCDTFDTVCAQFGGSLHLPGGIAGKMETDVPFKSLDDLHPDQLLKNVPTLARLADLRARLLNAATANDAAAELRSMFGGGSAVPAATTSAESKPEESTAETLARLFEKPVEAPGSKAAAPASVIDRLLKEAVTSTASAAPSPEQAQLLAMLDSELTARLRTLLHHPGFQGIESAWRGLDFLVRESSDNVELFVIDISRDDLDRHLASQENPAASPPGRQIEKITPAAVLCSWQFGASDTETLQRLARLGAACDTAIIACGAPDLVGCASFGSQPNPIDWSDAAGPDLSAFAELRRSPESSHIGLTAPRFLLRLPYGRESDPIQTFPFEESPGGEAHESYLWGSGAFLCGHRLVNAFAEDAWEMELEGAGGEIGGLPVHSFTAGGEKEAKPCAEAWLSEKAADVILRHGLMPILSVRGRDSVILVSLRSISDPASPLAFHLG